MYNSKRVQRKRVQGWKMPQNTIYVGRPTQWGNPYKHPFNFTTDRDSALEKYRLWLKAKLKHNPTFLDPLKGKDLACWCPLNLSCHADILIEALLNWEKKPDV